MTSYRYDELTWEEVDALPKENTIVFLSVNPVEEHGVHLPLGTDVFEGADLAEKAAAYLPEFDSELVGVVFPPIPLGSAGVTKDFPGTIHVGGKTLMRVVKAVCGSLARSGFRYILVVNHHGDPVHIKAIHVGAKRVMKKFNVKIYEPAGNIIYGDESLLDARIFEKTGLERKYETHADVVETSHMLYRYPRLVKETYKSLKPFKVDISQQMRKGNRTFKKMGSQQGHLGSPALADAELGRIHLEDGGRLLAECAFKLHRGEPLPQMGRFMRNIIRFLIRLD